MIKKTHTSIDKLFRKSYGKITSLLIARYGVAKLELIENAIMESYYRALKTWPYKGTPENAHGWLYRVAHNALIDVLRKTERRGEVEMNDHVISQYIEESFDIDHSEIKDPELKLLFLICHPELSKEDQLAFMLKTLSGFGDKEIANALMVNPSTIKKRLQRARSTIKTKGIKFDWPSDDCLSQRLDMVHRSLYLLFNEGFYSTHSHHWTRKDLCLEAMRLCKYLSDHTHGNHDSYALVSLMCYHISRYESRLDDQGNVVLLNEQDRTKWDSFFIKLGHHYLGLSAKDNNNKTKYQLEAFISAQHCLAKNIEDTNWSLLKSMYQALYRIDHQDLVLLNLVIVHLHLDEVEDAKKLFEGINPDAFTFNKTVYYMVGVELYSKLKDRFHIELLLERAITSSQTEKESTFLKAKLKISKNGRHQ